MPIDRVSIRLRAGVLPVLTLAASVLATTVSAAPLPIVERAIAYHGGDLYRASETRLQLCSRSGCFHVGARVAGDLYTYTAEGATRSGQLRVRTRNEGVERWRDGEPVPVQPEEEQALRDWVMARVYFCFLPYRLNDPSVQQQDLGLETWDGRPLHKVKVTFAAGSSTDAHDEYLYWFDPETARLEQFAYSFQGNPGGLRFRRGLNYRRIGGLLFFDQENLGAEGDDLKVDQITPQFVAERMSPVSMVELREIEVVGVGE